MSRVCSIEKYVDLQNFAKDREAKGCERYMPVRGNVTDGTVVLLPGKYSFAQTS